MSNYVDAPLLFGVSFLGRHPILLIRTAGRLRMSPLQVSLFNHRCNVSAQVFPAFPEEQRQLTSRRRLPIAQSVNDLSELLLRKSFSMNLLHKLSKPLRKLGEQSIYIQGFLPSFQGFLVKL